MQRRFVTIDVFPDGEAGGNPLAVVLDGQGLSARQMQILAKGFNFSETTFVMPPADPASAAKLRIFTPAQEIPFAGHPNIGTALVLAVSVCAIAAPWLSPHDPLRQSLLLRLRPMRRAWLRRSRWLWDAWRLRRGLRDRMSLGAPSDSGVSRADKMRGLMILEISTESAPDAVVCRFWDFRFGIDRRSWRTGEVRWRDREGGTFPE